MPILQQIGIDPGQPMVMPIRRVIVPPAKAPRTVKRAARPKTKAKAGKTPGKRRKK
jgi:hypothetical protein